MPTLPTTEAFLLDNLRGPAIKQGCIVVSGYNEHLELIASRVPPKKRGVLMENFARMRRPGVCHQRPPAMPDNIYHAERGIVPSIAGAAVLFEPLNATMEFVPGARIMGPLECIKPHLKGTKFSIRNRCGDLLCVELNVRHT